MSKSRRRPGEVRDAICAVLGTIKGDAHVSDIQTGVDARLGGDVPRSSVRSSLNLSKDLFEKTSRGRYRLRPHR